MPEFMSGDGVTLIDGTPLLTGPTSPQSGSPGAATPPPGTPSREEAKLEAERLMADKDSGYRDRNHPKHAETRARVRQLWEIHSPEPAPAPAGEQAGESAPPLDLNDPETIRTSQALKDAGRFLGQDAPAWEAYSLAFLRREPPDPAETIRRLQNKYGGQARQRLQRAHEFSRTLPQSVQDFLETTRLGDDLYVIDACYNGWRRTTQQV